MVVFPSVSGPKSCFVASRGAGSYCRMGGRTADAPRLVVQCGRISSCVRSKEMKGLVFLLLTSISVVGQVSDKVKAVTFDRADAGHCRVVMIEGRPMLQTVYSGTD